MALTEENGKVCPDCGVPRPLTEFYQIRAARYVGGIRYSASCKMHQKIRNAAARKNAAPDSGTRHAIRRANKRWADSNPEANRDSQARWRKSHPEEAAEAHRRWQLANPEANREKARRHLRKKRGESESDA